MEYLKNVLVFYCLRNDYHPVRLEVFTVMKIQFVVFWVVTPFSDMVRYQCFRGLYCHCALKIEASWPSKTLVSYYSTWCHEDCDMLS
jgi:hypothetical protein